jgi:hypothetical protein
MLTTSIDRLPIRLSQTTGDITTTTVMTDGTTFDPTTTPLYPPSFSSQPPTLPSSFLLNERDGHMDELDMYTNIISPPISPDIPQTSRLGSTVVPQPAPPGYVSSSKMPHGRNEIIPPTQPSQYDLPTLSSSPFDPPTQPFSHYTPLSPSSSASPSHVGSSQHPFPPSQPNTSSSSHPSSSLPPHLSSPVHSNEGRPETRPDLPATQNHSAQTDHTDSSPHRPAHSPTAPSKPITMPPPAAPVASSHSAPLGIQRSRTSSTASMTTTLQFGQSPGKPTRVAAPATADHTASRGTEGDAGRKVSGGSAGSHESVAFSWGLGSG